MDTTQSPRAQTGLPRTRIDICGPLEHQERRQIISRLRTTASLATQHKQTTPSKTYHTNKTVITSRTTGEAVVKSRLTPTQNIQYRSKQTRQAHMYAFLFMLCVCFCFYVCQFVHVGLSAPTQHTALQRFAHRHSPTERKANKTPCCTTP